MAIDAFLDFKGAKPSVEGESQDSTLKDMFHVKSATFTISQEGTNVTGSGAGAGKANFQDFEFVIDTQKGSQQLMKHCAAGTHFDNVKLYLRKAGGNPKVFLTYVFKNVLISEYATSMDEESTDTIKFNYMSVFAEYYTQDNVTGALGSTPSRGGWDLKANKEVASA